jgi:hypothetical protein
MAQNDDEGIESTKLAILENIDQISSSLNRLRICASLVLGNHKDFTGRNLDVLLPIIQSDFDQLAGEMDRDTVGKIALTLIFLGDRERAEQAIETALQVELNPDDWDETYALIDFAKLFGNMGDAKRLRDVILRAQKHKDIWQLAEIYVAITESASKIGNEEISNDAQDALSKIASDPQAVAKRPNFLGALATWHRNQTNDALHPQVSETIQQALDLLQKDEDNADAIAYLGLTLAQNSMPSWAKHVLTYTTQSLRQEDDPNTAARVVGTAAQVAALLSDKEVLHALQDISNSIDDEWLQAEGLFWLAGWWAYLGEIALAKKLFLQAIEYGAWDEIDINEIQKSWIDQESANQLLSLSEYIGWPSTKVAVIFSELAILLSDPEPWQVEFGLNAIATIPEEYSEKRSLYLQMLVNVIRNFENPHTNLVDFYLAVLHQARDRDIGEFWASLRACLPALISIYGNSLGVDIWDGIIQLDSTQLIT